MIDSILSVGSQGIQNGLNTARQAAEDIATATTTPVAETSDQSLTTDITEAAVELKLGEQQVQASAAVVRTADDVLGALLDVTA